MLPPGRLAALFAVMLVAAAGNTAMQSLLPAIGTRLGIADWLVSAAFSWSALLWIFTAPRWARLSDRRGRRALMQLGLAGFTSSMLFCGLVLEAGIDGWLSAGATFALFALFRSLYGGFGSAAPPAVQAYAASRSSRADRTRILSLIASSFGLGTVIGPALAPYLIVPALGAASPLFMFAAIGILTMAVLRVALPDDAPRYAARGSVTSEPLSSSPSTAAMLADDNDPDHPPPDAGEAIAVATAPAVRLRWTDRAVRPWLVAGLVGGHAQAVLLGVIGFLILDRLGLRATPEAAYGPTGLVLTVGAVATLLAQWGLIPMLHLGPRASMLAGLPIAAAGTVMLGFAQDLNGIALANAVVSLGFGLFRPGFTAGASLAVGRERQGQVAGMIASINGAPYVAGPAAGVLLYGASAPALFGLVAISCAGLALWSRRAIRS